MTRIFSAVLFIFSLSPAFAMDFSDCLLDAESYGSHNHAVTPNPACYDLLKLEPNHIAVASSDGIWKVFASKSMLYLEKYSGPTMISRELLAGDQTKLQEIKTVKFDLNQSKLLILQQGDEGTEYLSYSLEFIGNVTPKVFLDHTIVEGAQSVSLSSDGNETKLLFPGVVKVYSSFADSRYKDQGDKYKVQLIRTEAP